MHTIENSQREDNDPASSGNQTRSRKKKKITIINFIPILNGSSPATENTQNKKSMEINICNKFSLWSFVLCMCIWIRLSIYAARFICLDFIIYHICVVRTIHIGLYGKQGKIFKTKKIEEKNDKNALCTNKLKNQYRWIYKYIIYIQ